MDRWQKIETAPLDQPILIVAVDSDGQRSVRYAYNGVPEDDEGPLEFCVERGTGGWDDVYVRATHWMPLPEPPEHS